jgi:hypothetical protein
MHDRRKARLCFWGCRSPQQSQLKARDFDALPHHSDPGVSARQGSVPPLERSPTHPKNAVTVRAHDKVQTEHIELAGRRFGHRQMRALVLVAEFDLTRDPQIPVPTTSAADQLRIAGTRSPDMIGS